MSVLRDGIMPTDITCSMGKQIYSKAVIHLIQQNISSLVYYYGKSGEDFLNTVLIVCNALVYDIDVAIQPY